MYQWFLDTKDLASTAAELVRSGEIGMLPNSAKQEWYNWLERDQRCVIVLNGSHYIKRLVHF